MDKEDAKSDDVDFNTILNDAPDPPDGGYGWVIVVAACLNIALVEGTVCVIGPALQPEWELQFASSAGATAFVASILAGTYSLVGPFCGALVDVFGCRVVCILGTLVAFCGFMASVYATHLIHLYITLGIIGGIGFGLMYLPSIVIVSEYFERRRGLATCIVSCGGGLGTFAWTPLLRFLLIHYTSNQTLMLLAAIILHGLVCGALLRALGSGTVQPESEESVLHERNAGKKHSILVELRSVCLLACHMSYGWLSLGEQFFWWLVWPDGLFANLQRALCQMGDVSLLRSPTFLMLCLASFLTMMAFYVPYIYLPRVARLAGYSQDRADFLVCILGIANIFARICLGGLSDHPLLDPLILRNIFITTGGVATGLVPFMRSYWMFCLYCIVFACTTASFGGLNSVICVELLGIEKLTNAYGILLAFLGVASLIGSPLAGGVADFTGNYDMSFFLMGGLLTLSAILCYPLQNISRWEMDREKEKEAKAVAEDGDLTAMRNGRLKTITEQSMSNMDDDCNSVNILDLLVDAEE